MITFEEVQEELLAIIDADPESVGKVVSDDIDPMTGKPNMECVYFFTENGDPLNTSNGRGYVGALGPPCCIVGHWFTKHPALIELAWDNIITNEGIEGVFEHGDGLKEEVSDDACRLLFYAQAQQDMDATTTWGSIRDDIANATPEQLQPEDNI